MMSPSSPNAIEARRCQPWTLVKPAGFIRPCQPYLAERPPSGPDWQHETTWDGYRTLHPHLKLTARGILIASKEAPWPLARKRRCGCYGVVRGQ
jgi:ATP-dependent DNA ligase